MDVIFHRNCLDGIYSSFLLNLLCKIVDLQTFQQFVQTIVSNLQGSDITHVLFDWVGKKSDQPIVIHQEFYHQKPLIPFNALSMLAGEYFPFKFPGKSKVLIIVDTNLVSVENIKKSSQGYDFVLIIDHHTSFKEIIKDLQSARIKNVYWIFSESQSACCLTLNFVNKYFNIKTLVNEQQYGCLCESISYVNKNDLKQKEDRESKCFVLGFYYFGLEMSHLNPNIFKRIGMMDLQYTLEKGRNQYQYHLKTLQDQILKASQVEVLAKGPFQSKVFFIVKPSNTSKISDLGNILAYLSAKNGLLNLAILYMSNSSEIRVSCRSHSAFQDPKALELATKFHGGGHTHAAGFKISSHQFKSNFKISCSKIKFQLSYEEIQGILFGDAEKG